MQEEYIRDKYNQTHPPLILLQHDETNMLGQTARQ